MPHLADSGCLVTALTQHSWQQKKKKKKSIIIGKRKPSVELNPTAQETSKVRTVMIFVKHLAKI
jgi:hypothetical protein